MLHLVHTTALRTSQQCVNTMIELVNAGTFSSKFVSKDLVVLTQINQLKQASSQVHVNLKHIASVCHYLLQLCSVLTACVVTFDVCCCS
jgi:hypothetical protein